MVSADAATLLGYVQHHPEVAPDRIADMIFRVRVARRYRALAMVAGVDDLSRTLRAVADGCEHPQVVRADTPATARRIGLVFPGQGSQRPGMGRLFYETVPAYRAEADRCAEAFERHFGESPLKYLLDEHFSIATGTRTVQPALFTQMAALAAVWRSFGISPHLTLGHSQGEIAAAYVSGAISLADAALVVGSRARAADELPSDGYAMAVIAADRDTCEDLLARRYGWAELSVVNSPGMTGISGDQATVQAIVDTVAEHDVFARVIGVSYPAHTSMMNGLADELRTAVRERLQNSRFLDTDIDCIGATLGGPIPADIPVDEYWFLNLRNVVRFDKAIASAVSLGVDTFVELAEHPILQLAIHENIEGVERELQMLVVGTSDRQAADLAELTRNLAALAVHHADFRWECLRTEPEDRPELPLMDFPNAPMGQAHFWQPYVSATEVPPQPEPQSQEPTPARLLIEDWVRLSRRSLVPPRSIGIIDHTGRCAELAAAVVDSAAQTGATADLIDDANSDMDTYVVLLPPSSEQHITAAVAEMTAFFGENTWWRGIGDTVTACWLVTVGGEAVVTADPPPDPMHSAASAGFRSVGAQYPGVRFRHLDLTRGLAAADAGAAIVAALHTQEESELALREGGLYAKRVIEPDVSITDTVPSLPAHVLIVGGTGNLGLEFCEHFARRGVRRITLVNRSGETAAVADRLRRVRSATATQVRVESCDITDADAVTTLADAHRDTPADLIIHAAVEYSGVELEHITPEAVDAALQGKVVGISRLLDVFQGATDCRVLLCSSISATVGGRGMILYAAANRMLDAMALRLQSEGLNCVSLQWGHWNVHRDEDGAAAAMLAKLGVIPMRPADALAVGMKPLRRNAIVAAFDLTRARSVLQTCGRGELLAQLESPATVDGPAAGPGDAEVSQRFLRLLAETIGVDGVDTIDKTVPMVAIGLDSLQALEVRRRVKVEFDHDLEVADLLGGTSIEGVLARLGAS
ncbi:polyketide synthase [Mycobacteriaceae bacterium 1482268.1]|nr:polyketide synthase [Mycobacteriaceae bacterium 1482268.1]